jgi:hypothetical protein
MSERRTSERRKRAREFRVDVKRGEHEQLKGLVLRLAEHVAQLQRQVDDLRRKIRPL